jgi:outer membrane immunogenic protein
MKKIVASAFASAAVLFTGSAIAADLPSRKGPAPAFVPPPPMWTGFYAGLNAGGAWSENNSVAVSSFQGPCNPLDPNCGLDVPSAGAAMATAATFSAPSSTNGGFIGGGQVGYNWVFAHSFVGGIEADIQGVASSGGSSNILTGAHSRLNSVAPFPLSSVATTSKSVDYLGTVRGRLGYLLTPTLLAYATGGLAYGGVRSSLGIVQGFTTFLDESTVASGAGAFSDMRVGWTVGGGLEWMFLPNWSAKVEYLYYDLGNVTYTVSPLAVFSTDANPPSLSGSALPQVRTRFDGHIARAGVNYHFNFGRAPTVAGY